MAIANKLEITLSFKPLMDGLNRFTAGINQRLQQVQQFNQKIQNGSAAMQQALGQVGAVLGAAALTRFAHEAREADKVQAQLIATLKKTGQTGALEALNAQAAALQRVTLFSDEAVNTVQRLLITYGLTAIQAGNMTESVLDFAQANNLAGETAAQFIGKALKGDSEELGRYNLKLDQTKDRLTAVADALKQFASGQARGAVPDAGARDVQARFADATENLGRAANQVMVPFLQVLIPLLEKVAAVAGALASKLAPIAPILGDLAVLALPVLAAFGAIKGIFSALTMASNLLSSSFALIAGKSFLQLNSQLVLMQARFGAMEGLLRTFTSGWAGLGRAVAVATVALSAFFIGYEAGRLIITSIENASLARLEAEDKVRQAAAGQTNEFTKQLRLLREITDARNTAKNIESALIKAVAERDALEKKQEQAKKNSRANARYGQKGSTSASDQQRIADLNQQILALAQQYRLATDPKFVEGQIQKNVTADATAATSQTPEQRAAREELEDRRALFELETQIREAELDGNAELQERLIAQRDEFTMLKDLGNEAYDVIRNRINLEAEERQKKRDDATWEKYDEEVRQAALAKEQEFSRALGDLAIERANIEGDRYRTAEEKQKALLPLYQQEAEILKKQVEYLERKKLLAAPSDQIPIQDQIDGLRGQQADNARGLAANKPQGFLQGIAGGMTAVQDQIGSWADMAARAAQTVWSGAINSIQAGLTGLLTRTMTLGQALRSVGLGFAQSMLQAITRMGAEWAVQMIMMLAKYAVTKAAMFNIDTLFAAKGLLLSAANAAKSLVMWLPSAIAASISSWGTAAAIGAAAVIGIIAATHGFADGGHVSGPGNGTSDSVNARLSNGEWVAPEWMVKDKRYGPVINMLESSRARGYKHGGFFQAMFASLGGYGPKAMLDFFVHPTGTGVLKNQQYLGLLGDSEHGSKASDLDPAFYQQTGFNLGSLPSDIASGMATPQYEASAASAGGGSGGGSAADLVDAVARKINVTAIVVPDEREAKRVARRGAAASDVIFIVRNNRAQIFGNGPL